MRILLTTDTIGGVWTFTRELTEQLLHDGHAVALVSFGRATSSAQRTWANTIAAQSVEGFLFRESEAPLEWMQENQDAFAHGAEELLRVAYDFSPDLLHTNQFCWGALPLNIPVLITAHSDVMSWAEACSPQTLHGSDWLTRYHKLVQDGLDGADAVIAPTVWMRDALRAHFDTPKRFKVIYNGRTVVPVSQDDTRHLRAISVGRLWDEAKGLSTLLDLDAPIPLYLAGEEQFEKASASSDRPGLRTLGILSEPDLLDFFRRSAIYIAPSLYEPFGLAPLEAALCGCAVIARNIASLREVWGEAALYFSTTAELEHSLRALTENRVQLESVQLASRQRGLQFTAARMAQSYLRCYEELLSGGLDKHPQIVEEELATHAA